MSKSIFENPILSFAGSIIAVVISIIGLVFAYQAYELSVLQYKQERLLILKGVFGGKGKSFSVASVTDQAHFLRGEAYFPPSVHNAPAPIDSSGMVWHMGSVVNELEEFIGEKVKSKEGFVQISNGDIPIVIKSYYAIKGEAYTDTSLYMLGMQVQIGEKEYSAPEVSLNSLNFIQRFPLGYEFNPKELDVIINNEKGLYLLPRRP